MANSIDIKVPDLGDFSDVEVIEVLVKAGDRVSKEDGLITLETDKAAMDVPAEEEGEIEEISVSVGDKVSAGDVIGRLKTGAGADESDDDANASDAAEGEAADARGAGGESVPAEEGEAGKEGEEATGDEAEASGKAEKQTVTVPDLGDFSDVEIIEVHVKAGDEVQLEDGLITLETDKAAMDVPATVAGRVDSVLVKVGDRVSEGSEIAVIEAAAGRKAEKPVEPGSKEPPAAAEKAEPESKPRQEEKKPAPRQDRRRLPPVDEAGFARAHASPSVR